MKAKRSAARIVHVPIEKITVINPRARNGKAW